MQQLITLSFHPWIWQVPFTLPPKILLKIISYESLDSDKLSVCELLCNILALEDGAFKVKHVA